MNATKREQQPFVYGSLSKAAIYLKELPPPVAAAPSTVSAINPDEVLWETIRESRVPGLFEEFLRRFPNSGHAAEARTRHSEAPSSRAASSLPQGGPAQPRVMLQSPSEGSPWPQAIHKPADCIRKRTPSVSRRLPLATTSRCRFDSPADRASPPRCVSSSAYGRQRSRLPPGRAAMWCLSSPPSIPRAVSRDFTHLGPRHPGPSTRIQPTPFHSQVKLRAARSLRKRSRGLVGKIHRRGQPARDPASQTTPVRRPAVLEPVWRLVERERTAGR